MLLKYGVVMTKCSKLNTEILKLQKENSYIDSFIAFIEDYWEEDIYICVQVIKKVLKYMDEYQECKVDTYIELLLISAKYYIELCEYDKAINILTDILDENNEKYNNIEDDSYLVRASNMLCRVYDRESKSDIAILIGNKNIEYAKSFCKPEIITEVMIEVAAIACNANIYELADKILSDLDEMDDLLSDRHKLQRDIICLKKLIDTGDITKAVLYADNLKDIVKKNKDIYKIESLYILLLRAILNHSRGLSVQCEKYFKELSIELTKINHIYLLSKSNFEWATILKNEGNDKEYISKLKEIVDNDNMPVVTVKQAYDSIAKMYEDKGKWELAYSTLKHSQELDKDDSITSYSKDILDITDLYKRDIAKDYADVHNLLDSLSNLGGCIAESVNGDIKLIYPKLEKIFKMDLLIFNLAGCIEKDFIVIHPNEDMDSNNNVSRTLRYLAEHSTKEEECITIGNGDFLKYHIRDIEDSRKTKISSITIVPVYVAGKVVGSIGIGSYKSNKFNKNDLCSMKIIANYIGIQIQSSNTLKDIQKLKKYDELTGVLKREEFLRKGEKAFKYNRVHSIETTVILLLLDGLKNINIRYGYKYGDDILSEFGKILNKVIKDRGYCGRYNGQIFAIVLNNVSKKESQRICKEALEELKAIQFVDKNNEKIKVSVSGGVYRCNEYTRKFAEAIKYADTALYRSRLLGKGNIMIYVAD